MIGYNGFIKGTVFASKDSEVYVKILRHMLPSSPAGSPHLPPTKNVWDNMKRRIRQRQRRTTEQLKSYNMQEWTKFPIAKLI